jgi:hypothetical protein
MAKPAYIKKIKPVVTRTSKALVASSAVYT